MSKKKIAAALSVTFFSILSFWGGYWYTGSRMAGEKARMEQELARRRAELLLPEETEDMEEPETLRQEVSLSDPDKVQTEQEAYSFYLVEEFGYVNIYRADRETIYEYTDIPIDCLPEEIQIEICTGKGLVSEQELYDFLENYSS